jgi:lysophospholipase L1-like esterase
VRVLLRVLAVLVGLLLAVIASEGVVYLLDPYGAPTQATNGRLYQEELVELDAASARIFRHKPDARVELRGHLFRTNARGLRGPELETPKPAGVKRLVFLGDSVVLGWGVAEEDTFVRGTEQALTTATGERWETVNAGHLLHDTTQELGVLEEVGLECEPDVLVLVFVENDIVLTRSVFELQGREDDQELSEDARTVLRRTQQLARIKPYLSNIHAVLEFLYVRSSPAGQQGSAEHAEELGLSLEAGWDASREALRRMRALSEEHGFRFGVFDYRRGTPLSEKLAAFCAEEQIPYASIAFTEEEEAQDIENSAADAHANPLGQRFLTEHILEALRATGLVEGLGE